MSTNNDEPIIYPADDVPNRDPLKPDQIEPLSDAIRLEWTTAYLRSAKPIKCGITTFIYDASGKLIKTVEPK